MHRIHFVLHIVLAFFLSTLSLAAENGNGYINPMAHEVDLSGNFGELRSNHFHSGLDYRTESTINKPIRSIADGYISRILVSPNGYGKALYVTHPATGETSVYAHLNKFAPNIDSVVRAYQYKFNTFTVDVSVDGIEVKQGDIIAYSGNTGSSGGPHLHFEIRKTESEEYIDPLLYTMGVTDHVRPKFFTLKVYPQTNEGSIDGMPYNKKYDVVTSEGKARFAYPVTIKAWGKIGLGIRAFDYSANSRFVFGIRTIKLEVDNVEIFHYRNTGFHPNQTRYINSFVDYEELKRSNTSIMKSFIDPGNFAPLYEQAIDKGIITIDEERDYKIKYTIADSYENTSVFEFTIKGKETKIEQKKCNLHMPYNVINSFRTEDVELIIPKHYLYTDICFDYSLDSCHNGVYSHYHALHSEYTPLHDWVDVAIKLAKKTKDTTKLYAVRYEKNGRTSTYAGNYSNNWFKFKTRDLGKFVLKIDTIAPTITLTHFIGRSSSPHISFKINDSMSGIDTYNGYIDGNWVLFEYDQKYRELRYDLHEPDLIRGREHEFKLIVTDRVGNENTFERKFFW